MEKFEKARKKELLSLLEQIKIKINTLREKYVSEGETEEDIIIHLNNLKMLRDKIPKELELK